MTDKLQLTWRDIHDRARRLLPYLGDHSFLFPVPRGGIYAAQAVLSVLPPGMVGEIVEDPVGATHIVDDIVDSGGTREAYNHYNTPFLALVDKTKEPGLPWVVFPWERMNGEEAGPEENIRRLLQFIGEDSDREGLLETPSRVLRSYRHLFGGYKQNPQDVLKVFEDGACDEMVVVKDVEFFSMCEHHLLPFFGKAHIGYIPDRRVVGVSKLVRVLEVYARRLQIQERLCQQVTKALDDHLKPLGSACVLEARHLCMVCRGVEKQNSVMVTSSLTGVFRETGNGARQEFLSIIR